MRPWSWRRSSTRTKQVMEDYRDHTRKQTDLSPTGAVMGGVPGHHAHGFNPSARYGGCKLVGDGTRRHAFMPRCSPVPAFSETWKSGWKPRDGRRCPRSCL